jgi:hypothetical protein
MEKWDEELIKKIEEINKSEETPYAYFINIAERDEALHEDMKRVINVVKENSKPTKRWWHVFKKSSPMTFDIPGRPTFTKEELAERRAFLDGYGEGRKDGDSHEAYKLWKKMRDFE